MYYVCNVTIPVLSATVNITAALWVGASKVSSGAEVVVGGVCDDVFVSRMQPDRMRDVTTRSVA